MEKEENQNSTSVDQNHDKMSEAEKTDKNSNTDNNHETQRRIKRTYSRRKNF